MIHLDMGNAEEPTMRGMICKERLFVTTTVRQGIAVCSSKQGNDARFLLMSTLIGGADAEPVPFTDLHRSYGEGVKKRRGFRVMKRVKKGRHLTVGKNTAQEPRQLED